MNRRMLTDAVAATVVGTLLVVAGCSTGTAHQPRPSTPAAGAPTTGESASATRRTPLSGPHKLLPGMPPPLDPRDVYAADRPGKLSPATAGALPYVYVPHTRSNDVYVIDQRTMRVVRRFPAGAEVQHVVPSYDLRTLYATGDNSHTLTPIDPRTGKPGRPIPVLDPYNLYFTPDGRYAVDVAEARKALLFFDPHTWRLRHRLDVPRCGGIDHLDYSADGRLALVSCEFANRMLVVDVARQRALRFIQLTRVPNGMPQDVKLSPDGRYFYVADMMADGIYQIDGSASRVERFIPTGRGTHGLYVDRNSTRMFVTNRGEGSITVVTPDTGRVLTKWHLPGGGSPDMGGLNADGTVLWLSGRYDGVVYAIDARNGRLLARIRVGSGPHGLCVWPQPGRYSLGHTGVLR